MKYLFTAIIALTLLNCESKFTTYKLVNTQTRVVFTKVMRVGFVAGDTVMVLDSTVWVVVKELK
jgi:hypothetical protein